MTKRIRKIVAAGVLLAIGIVLPYIFHTLLGPVGGRTFLPMHFPVFIGGLLLGGWRGFILGLILPPLNYLITGMPPFPSNILMMFELSIYGLSAGYFLFIFSRFIRVVSDKRGRIAGVLPSLIISQILGRLALGLGVVIFGLLLRIPKFPTDFIGYLGGAVLVGLPGILIQIVLIPLIIWRLKIE